MRQPPTPCVRLALLLAVFAALAASAAAADRLYLAEYKFNDPRVNAMDQDGANVTPLAVVPQADWLVVGLQVDVANDWVYWTHGSFNQGAIRRAHQDGTGQQTILSGLTNPRGLALDAAAGKLYWSDTQDRRVYRANVDGSGLQAIVDNGNQHGHPTLDLVNGHVYFGDFSANEIRRCNLDGTQNQLVLAGGGFVDDAIGIALDLAGGKIYWTDAQTNTNHVARANLNGTGAEILKAFGLASSGLVGMVLDVDAGLMFWADEITDAEKGVWSAGLDGSNATRIYASPATWNAGALTRVDAACATPTLSFGAGCAGGGTVVPMLSGTDCATPGAQFTLVVDGVGGGTQAMFFLGATQASFPLGGGCSFLLAPVLAPIFSVPLGGGITQLQMFLSIPGSAPIGAVATLQAFVVAPGVPQGWMNSNGIQVTIR